MTSLVNSLVENTKLIIVPVLKQYEAEYTADAYASVLEQAFNRLKSLYSGVATEANFVANQFVSQTDAENKKRFYKSLEKTVGVDLGSVVRSENLGDILKAKTKENVSLITSIPEEYFKKIEGAVYRGTTQKSSASSLIQQIQEIGNVTESRAKLIARDQTSKLNSDLNRQRQQNLGVEEYIWITADDDRVRDSHAANNGKRFRWDTPPKNTGHPGQDIQCRCIAQPIIVI